MLVGRVQNANQFSPMGIAFSPILWLPMLHMLSIVTGRKQRLTGALVILVGLPCLSQLIQVSMNTISRGGEMLIKNFPFSANDDDNYYLISS